MEIILCAWCYNQEEAALNKKKVLLSCNLLINPFKWFKSVSSPFSLQWFHVELTPSRENGKCNWKMHFQGISSSSFSRSTYLPLKLISEKIFMFSLASSSNFAIECRLFDKLNILASSNYRRASEWKKNKCKKIDSVSVRTSACS